MFIQLNDIESLSFPFCARYDQKESLQFQPNGFGYMAFMVQYDIMLNYNSTKQTMKILCISNENKHTCTMFYNQFQLNDR